MQSGRDDLASVDQVGHQALIDVEIAFVLPAIAEVMAPGEHSPDLRADPERVRQDLKHDVPVRGAIARAAQRREGQGVRGVVGEIEAAFQRIRWFLGVGESSQTGPLEPGDLLAVGWLLTQRLPGAAEVLKRRGHARRR